MKKLLISLIIIMNLILIPVFADSYVNTAYVLGLPVVDSNTKINLANYKSRIINNSGSSTQKALDIATRFVFYRGNYDNTDSPHYSESGIMDSFWSDIDEFLAGETDYSYYTLFSSVNIGIQSDYERCDFYLVLHNNRLGIMPLSYSSSQNATFKVFEIPYGNTVDYVVYKFTVYCAYNYPARNYISVPTKTVITNPSNYITLQYSYKPSFNVGSYDYLSSYNSYNANNYIDNFYASFVSNLLTINEYDSGADSSDSSSLYNHLTGSFSVTKDKDYGVPDSQPIVPVPDFNVNDYYYCSYKHIGDEKINGLYINNRFYPRFTEEFRNQIGMTNLYVSVQIQGQTEPVITRYNVGIPINYDDYSNDSYYVELIINSEIADFMSVNSYKNVYITCEYKNAMGEFVGANMFVFDISSDNSLPVSSINSTSQDYSDYDNYFYNIENNYNQVIGGGSSISGSFNANFDDNDSSVFGSIFENLDKLPSYIINFVKGIFSGLTGVLELFKIVFSWLPAEIVGIIFSGLMLSSIYLIIKAIRGG